jgi:molybdate transport system substrate-binding protein
MPFPFSRAPGRAAASLLVIAALAVATAQAGEVTVSAAVSLGRVLRDIAPAFEAAHPAVKVNLNVGGSGALLAQIAKGAPADVFVSADQETMDRAQALGLVQAGQRRDVASNALVLIVPAAASAKPRALADLTDAGRYARIAIGAPASVPVGRYTQSALEAAELWAAIAPRAITAHNARQALDYVARAEVDAGFVYATDAALMPSKVTIALPVPTPHPIRYPAAVLAAAPNAADAGRFMAFLFTPQAQAVLARHGFGRP